MVGCEVKDNVADPDESMWIQQAAQGDRKAFAQLVDLHLAPVRCWLIRLTGREHAAEDLTQETFLKAWTALPSYRQTGPFRSWLFRIAKNCWIDARRHSDLHKKVPLSMEVEGKAADPLAGIIGAEVQQQFQLALATLPSKYRAAYLLWTQEELPYAEIAEILGVSEENARWRVFQARQALLKQLTPYLRDRET